MYFYLTVPFQDSYNQVKYINTLYMLYVNVNTKFEILVANPRSGVRMWNIHVIESREVHKHYICNSTRFVGEASTSIQCPKHTVSFLPLRGSLYFFL